MKGFVKVEISKAELTQIKAVIEPLKEWVDSFIVNVEESGWWIFKEEVVKYRKDKPPKGITVFDWDCSIGALASLDSWVEDLIRITDLAKAGTDIYLDSDIARTLVRFRNGEFSKK
jgi:hypothetical protein